MMTEREILQLIQQDSWMMGILHAVRDLHLPDSWVGAGFVRGKVWDYLHGFSQRIMPEDIDVVYYDIDYPEESFEKEMEAKLRVNRPELKWSVKNQARMHLLNGEQSYENTKDAISRWPEFCTAVAVRLKKDDALELLAPWGIEDLVNMRIRMTPTFEKRQAEFVARQAKKNWKAKWPRVQIELTK